MALDAKALITFSDELNATWWPQLRKLDEAVLARNLELSFRSILGVFTHIANIEHAWMDIVEGKREANWARTSTKTWDALEPVIAYVGEARARTHELVDGLDEDGLARVCQVDNGAPDFARQTFTVEELLLTLFTHEQWHRGEVVGALWSMDIEPPKLDYPRYGTPVTQRAGHPPG